MLTRSLTLCMLLGLAFCATAAEEALVSVGDTAPGFALENEKGETVKLSDYRDKESVVLVFTRAHW
jgi:peroxiredoxin